MADYTEADAATVRAAIITKAEGRRPVSVTVGERKIDYANASIADLESLLNEINRQLEIAAGTSTFGYAHITTSKGF